jgi:CBS domain-containing protein
VQVKDVMTEGPTWCTKDTSLTDVARLMVQADCGIIPVVEGNDHKLIGVITDRDIVCRTLADGKDPYQMAAGDCMTVPPLAVPPNADLDAAARLMKEHQVRRVFVQDDSGRCLGVISQADLARSAPDRQTADVIKRVSQPAPMG